VIVVGNLTVGGTGKTPLVIQLVEQLRANGFSPAVISRGYSGDAPSYPYQVTADSPVNESGDEPALIVKRTKVPMVVGPNRGASIDLLLAHHSVDVIISDDGLQHLDKQTAVHAVAGIGNPQRFFDTCKLEGYHFESHAFPDHHHFNKHDLMFGDQKPILMTEKDAVKCQRLTIDNAWYLPVDAKLSDGFLTALLAKLASVKK